MFCIYIKIFAIFDENSAMTLQDIKETKRDRRVHGRTDNVKTLYHPQIKFVGGLITNKIQKRASP